MTKITPQPGILEIDLYQGGASHIEGVSQLESDSILRFLYQHVVLPEFTCRVHWQQNSIVMWDNRSTQHKPVNDFLPAPRALHRVVSEGFAPY